MKTLRRGDRGPDVRQLQSELIDAGYGVLVDGVFGPGTEDAVESFQLANGLRDDGIVGRATWRAFGVEDDPSAWPADAAPVEWLGWKKTPCDMTVPGDPDQGYDSTTLRSDVADAFAMMRMELVALGGKITSAGGRRKPRHSANSNQSKKSMHYVGRAHDLALPSGMQNPETDLYVVERDPEDPRYWIVWARADGGEERMLDGWVHATQSSRRVGGRFVNLTDLMSRYGFERIGSRRSYSASNYGAAEWWHFQKTDDLVPGVSTFGEELLKVWRIEELEGTTPWDYRDAVFGKDWF